MQVHTLSAAVHTVFIYDSCSVGTDTTSCTLLTPAHDMVTVITDNETTENIIVLFSTLDVDFEKSLHIKESLDNAYEISVDESNLVTEDTKAAEAIKNWFSKVQEKNGGLG